MGFRTKLDYSDNRQILQRTETHTTLSGASTFGVPFSGLTSGVDVKTRTETYVQDLTIFSQFSGNNSTTLFYWGDPRMASANNVFSAITMTTSGITQESGDVYNLTTSTTIDGNFVGLTYSGVSFSFDVDEIIDQGGGNYSGNMFTNDFVVISAETLDFKERTIWVDNPEITRTDRLILTRGAQPGYILASNGEGMGTWIPSPSGFSATTVWIPGSNGVNSVRTKNSSVDAIGDNSIAYGDRTTASGFASHASGQNTLANAPLSHAEGDGTTASGSASHAEGRDTLASGFYTHAEGRDTQAIGNYTHTEGRGTTAIGTNSHAEGLNSIASGLTAHAEGQNTKANGDYSHAEGNTTTASGVGSHAEGFVTTALGNYSHAEGQNTQANGIASHSEGQGATASGNYSHAEGQNTSASGLNSHAEGFTTTASGSFSHSEGRFTLASGYTAHAEGELTQAVGTTSHAEGNNTQALGGYSHSEGWNTIASGLTSHAEGRFSLASGDYSHAEGIGGTASGYASHSEGWETIASGMYSHSEGGRALASGDYSHAEGSKTVASGVDGHAEGHSTSATTHGTHSEGGRTLAKGEWSHAQGFAAISNGLHSHAGGKGFETDLSATTLVNAIVANGNTSFVHFRQTLSNGLIGAYGNHSAILGGLDHNINTGGHNSAILGGAENVVGGGVERSVVLGGSNLVATSDDTVYVPDLVIDGLTNVSDLQTNANGLIIDGASDISLKENVIKIDSALSKINNLRGVSFDWKPEANMGSGKYFGLIAQEVQAVIPEIVKPRVKYENHLTLDYKALIPWLVEAIKELSGPNKTSFNEVQIQTETITSEDSDILLNFNGTHETSLQGGIVINKGVSDEINSQFVINGEGDWLTNTYILPHGLIIPEFTPLDSSDTNGKIGEITRDDDYLYIKGKNGQWKRSNLENF